MSDTIEKCHLWRKYEKQVAQLIRQRHESDGPTFLWNHTPIDVLKKHGLVDASANDFAHVQDVGADILQDHGESVTLHQAKAYSSKRVCVGDVGSFWMMVSLSPHHRSGVIWTTVGVTTLLAQNIAQYNRAHGREVFKVQIHAIENDNEQQEGDEYQLTSSTYSTRTHRLPPLYDYQVNAAVDVRAALARYGRAQLQMPPGVGKTRTSQAIVCNDEADETIWRRRLVVVLAPTCALTMQNAERWKDTGATVQVIDSELRCGATRNVAKLISIARVIGNVALCCTYDSCDVVVDLIRLAQDLRDQTMVVVDEFHNLEKRMLQTDNHPMYKLLFDPATCAREVLFMSATPRIIGENGSDVVFNSDAVGDVERCRDRLCSADLGPLAHRMTMKVAVDRGLIVPLRVLIPDIALRESPEMGANGDTDVDEAVSVTLDSIVEQQLAFHALCMRDYSARKGIVYAQTIQQADAYVNAAAALFGRDNVAAIHGKTKTAERQRILSDFNDAEGVYVVVSIRILDEGIDIPSCDHVYMLSNVNRTRTVQRICRATRVDRMRPQKVASVLFWSDEMTDIVQLAACLQSQDALDLGCWEFKHSCQAIGAEPDQENYEAPNCDDRKTTVGRAALQEAVKRARVVRSVDEIIASIAAYCSMYGVPCTWNNDIEHDRTRIGYYVNKWRRDAKFLNSGQLERIVELGIDMTRPKPQTRTIIDAIERAAYGRAQIRSDIPFQYYRALWKTTRCTTILNQHQRDRLRAVGVEPGSCDTVIRYDLSTRSFHVVAGINLRNNVFVCFKKESTQRFRVKKIANNDTFILDPEYQCLENEELELHVCRTEAIASSKRRRRSELELLVS